MLRCPWLPIPALVLLGLVAGAGAALPPPPDGEPPERPAAGGGPLRPAPPGDDPAPPPAAQPFPAWSPPPAPAGPAVARDHVVVSFEPRLPGWQRRQIAAAAGGVGFKAAQMGRFVKVGVARGDSVEALVGRLSGVPGVLLAEPDPLCWGLAVAVAEAADKRTFSDPLVFFQWTFERIRLPRALDLNSTDGDGVIVAVIDSGVASGDGTAFPARRGLDLEGTRFLPGIDLVDGGPPHDEGVGPIRFGHGTFIAAQIAATVNNGLSGASIAHRATILPIRVIGTNNVGFFSDVADGIDFAVAQGARVINLSLGGRQGSTVVQNAIIRAHQAGVVIVAAAGNEAQDPDFGDDVAFPARYPQVIAVGATRFSDQRASYSNPGPGLDLMAPAGENPGATVGGGLPDAAVAPTFVVNPASGQVLYADFAATGTSFAAPQVAGGVALLMALGVRDPEVIRSLLIVTARDLGAPGLDNDTGEGLIDLFEAHRGLGFSF